MTSGMVKSGSAKIYYELYGEVGEVLVLLHGNSESIIYFQPQIEYFKDKYQVLAIDSRGHGESSFGSGTLSLGAMANDVVNVAESLGLNKINLLGFSDGANIAMLVAMKNPGLIDKLILVGGNLHPIGMTPGSLLLVWFGYISSKLAGVVDKRNKLYHEFFSLMIKEPRLKARDLSTIKAKTLVMAGGRDMIRRSHTKLIAKSIKNAELKIIEEGDHFISNRMPDEFNEIVDEFLG